MLVDDLDLLAKVLEILKVCRNNKELTAGLFELGIHKKDGKPYGTDRVGRIRPVVMRLSQSI